MLLYPLSDIHLELTTKGWKLPDPLPRFDVMLMAGDLIPDMEKGVEWLQENVPDDRDVIYVAGNHEAYNCDLDETVLAAKRRARGTRIHVLADDAVTLRSTTFIGSTLWTDFALLGDPQWGAAVAGEYMNDYRRIHLDGRLLRPSNTLERHHRSRAFLREELSKPRAQDSKVVVVTHHGIHSQAVRPGKAKDLISSAYTSAMEDFVAKSGADLWVYGHVHVSDDRMLGPRTRVVSNPKGYGPSGGRPTHDNQYFDPHLIIEI
jgi:predicted phosphodiesterase